MNSLLFCAGDKFPEGFIQSKMMQTAKLIVFSLILTSCRFIDKHELSLFKANSVFMTLTRFPWPCPSIGCQTYETLFSRNVLGRRDAKVPRSDYCKPGRFFLQCLTSYDPSISSCNLCRFACPLIVLVNTSALVSCDPDVPEAYHPRETLTSTIRSALYVTTNVHLWNKMYESP
jgi:hypothetical protein